MVIYIGEDVVAQSKDMASFSFLKLNKGPLYSSEYLTLLAGLS